MSDTTKDEIIQKLQSALGVIIKTPHILTYLASYDPKALSQAKQAYYQSLSDNNGEELSDGKDWGVKWQDYKGEVRWYTNLRHTKRDAVELAKHYMKHSKGIFTAQEITPEDIY